MSEEHKIDEELEEAPVDASEDEQDCCVGPCDVWPPSMGPCGSGKVWVRIAGRWICK